MRRMQLFEIEDRPWFPASVRNFGTDFLGFMLTLGDNYAPAAPVLAQALRSTGVSQVVDLGAGAGGPWQRLLPALVAQGITCEVVLTDRYPNPARISGLDLPATRSGQLTYYPKPVDALAVPVELGGFRTLFTAFHHFPPVAASALLRDAVRSRSPIGIFESTQRTRASLLLFLLTPLFVFLATPFIRLFRVSRLVLTYLLPIVPLTVLWDGLVSCLRFYTVAELQALVASVPEAEVTRGSLAS